MKKILTIALNEYRSVILTKSFLIGLLLPPLLYGGMFLVLFMIGGKTDLRERKLIIVDPGNQLTEVFEQAVLEYNQGSKVYNDEGTRIGPKFAIEAYRGDSDEISEIELQLSDQIRNRRAFAFLVVGSDYLSVDGGNEDFLRYYTNAPTYFDMPNWITRVAESHAEKVRIEEAGLDERLFRRILNHSGLKQLNLAERKEDGSITRPKEGNQVFNVIVPACAVMMLFFSVQVTIPVMLNSVIEEKMQRIAEVLLSSVTSIQLLWGKLSAAVAIALTFSLVYLTTGSITLLQLEQGDLLSSELLIYFFPLLIANLLTFGSLLAATGAACQDIKDSQNMAGMVIIVMVIPLLLSISAISAPESSFSKTLSIIPPFAPMMMTLRLAISPEVAWWEPVISVLISSVFAAVIVFGASRIFRIGILTQGQSPTWRQLLKWAFKG